MSPKTSQAKSCHAFLLTPSILSSQLAIEHRAALANKLESAALKTLFVFCLCVFAHLTMQYVASDKQCTNSEGNNN